MADKKGNGNAPGTELELHPRVMTILERLGVEMSDPAEFTIMIAERLSLAETPEELFDPSGTFGWEDREGVPFQIRQIWWLPSTYKDGLGFFAIVEAADMSTGQLTTLTSGSANVLMQLARAKQKGWLDKPCMLKRADTATAEGYYPHRLVLAL